MANWANHLINFYKTLMPLQKLPNGVQWLHPQRDAYVLHIAEQFFYKFYSDNHQRTLLLGINPGRFGAGITGVNFTAPKQLTEFCEIEHSFKDGSELSAEFIYSVITRYGGVKEFYSRFFIGSVCPLGFVQNGKNINYYDDKELLLAVEPFIIENLSRLLTFNVNRKRCICIGGEKNYRYLASLNASKKWFKEIVPLPHPRFVMQYKRKELQTYINAYLVVLFNSINDDEE